MEKRPKCSFHLRPVYFSAKKPMVYAASNDYLLIAERRFPGRHFLDYSILRIPSSPLEKQLIFVTQLSSSLIPHFADCFYFKNDFTLCFSAYHAVYTLTATSDEFKDFVSKKYNILDLHDDDKICDMTSFDGNLLIAVCSRTGFWPGGKVYRVKLPPLPHSEAMELTPTMILNWTLEEGERVRPLLLSGCMFAARVNNPTKNYAYIGDFRHKDRRHVIKLDADVHNEDLPCLHPFGDSWFWWKTAESIKHLSIISWSGNDSKQVDYEAPFIWPKQSGNRLFSSERGTIFMGFPPGADVPLEEIAAAVTWRGLTPRGKRLLCEEDSPNNRDILLQAIKEKDNESSVFFKASRRKGKRR